MLSMTISLRLTVNSEVVTLKGGSRVGELKL